MYPVTILCLVYMLTLFGVTAFRLIRCSRQKRLQRLKGFKRGRFTLIYLAAIPLFFLAQRFNGQSVEGAIWFSFRACFEILAMRFDYTTVAPLMAQNLLYHIAVEVLFVLVVLNALLFTLSFCGQWLYNRILLAVIRRSRKNVVAVIGTDKNSLSILGTVPKGYRALLMADLTPELKNEAFIRGAACHPVGSAAALGDLFKKRFGDFGKRKISVIINLEDDEKSLLYVKALCALADTGKQENISLTEEAGLAVYVFASKANENLFTHYVERSKGIIQIVNRHKLISMDFIDRYPLTQFMTPREICCEKVRIDGNDALRSTATINDDIGLNVFMIGFGKLNESLFLASVSNNQFLTRRAGKLQPKQVTYHLFDRYYPSGKFTEDKNVHSGALHFGYLRYREFLKYYEGKEDAFLELPPMPANVIPHACEVSNPKFYSVLREELRKGKTYNYIIISYGTDMENIDLAEKLAQKWVEWDVESPVKIFVKVSDAEAAKQLRGEFANVIFFGSNGDCVYNAEVIMHEKIQRMARLRHLLYAEEFEAKKCGSAALDEAAIQRAARESWYGFKEYQREANTYACLSTRMKLQLCGYDYSESGADLSGKFLDAYQGVDANGVACDARAFAGGEVMGKPIVQYSNEEQFRASLRWTLTVQEHQRWCANMIANGFVPCSIRELKTQEKKQWLEKRKHANLTTMEGLVEYRKIMAEKTGKSQEETDVIRYDYQLMDDIDWLMKRCKYNIVENANLREPPQ